MGYYSVIECSKVLFDEKYKDVINPLLSLSNNHALKSFKEIKMQFTENSLVQEIISNCEKLVKKTDELDFTSLFYFFDDNGWLDMEDYHAKHYSDYTLVILIASMIKIEQKIEVLFEGDDGDCWGYLISCNGGGRVEISAMSKEWTVSHIITKGELT